MNIQEIDKWLDNEYGVSYTSLEKIHDWLVDENMKKDKEIERLNKRIKECEEAYLRTRHQYSELENKYLTDEYIINEIEKYLIEYSQDLEFRCYANTFLEKLRELKGDSSNG